jgi:uncharacterized membrane protein YidH (DUF202 family)
MWLCYSNDYSQCSSLGNLEMKMKILILKSSRKSPIALECLGRFLCIIGQNLSVLKFNQLHVGISQQFFINFSSNSTSSSVTKLVLISLLIVAFKIHFIMPHIMRRPINRHTKGANEVIGANYGVTTTF